MAPLKNEAGTMTRLRNRRKVFLEEPFPLLADLLGIQSSGPRDKSATGLYQTCHNHRSVVVSGPAIGKSFNGPEHRIQQRVGQ